MKNINQYNFFKLFLFGCVITIVVAIVVSSITYHLRLFGLINVFGNTPDTIITVAIVLAIIFITLQVLSKTGKDTFLLKKQR